MPDADEHERQLELALSGIPVPDGIRFSAFHARDFPSIQALSLAEGWSTPTTRPAECLQAWINSRPAIVARGPDKSTAGFLRALTDAVVSTYVGELLVAPEYRRRGLGTAMMEVCRRMYPQTRLDLLSTEDADAFYRRTGWREFAGFRRNPSAYG